MGTCHSESIGLNLKHGPGNLTVWVNRRVLSS